MNSGDTTTESLLNILGNGGNPTPYVGSGNTKTQNYIIDAIGRVNDLSDKLGGLTIVVLTQTEYDNLSSYDPNTLYVIKADS